jgi:hypothetical protein
MQVDRREMMRVVPLAIISSIVAVGHGSAATTENNMPSNIIEIVSFRLVSGVAEKDFLQAVEATNTFLTSQKGFVARRMSKDAVGNYFDHVEWATVENAKVAMESSMKQPELLPFIQMIDPASMSLVHNQLVVSVG